MPYIKESPTLDKKTVAQMWEAANAPAPTAYPGRGTTPGSSSGSIAPDVNPYPGNPYIQHNGGGGIPFTPPATPVDSSAWVDPTAGAGLIQESWQHGVAATAIPAVAPVSAPQSPAGSGGSVSSPAGGRAPAASGAPAPSATPYSGMSEDAYRQKLVDAVRGGVMSEYEANASVIRQNLNAALSNLDAENAALDPLYQKQLKTIKQNTFDTKVRQTELMNQGGWNASNSGLAVGEHTRIQNQGNQQAADADATHIQYENDILRRRTLAQTQSGEQLTTAEKIKNEKLAGAEATAMIQADDRNRQIFESDRGFAESVRQWSANFNLDTQKFNESVNQYYTSRSDSLAQKAADLKNNAMFDTQMTDNMVTKTFTQIMSSSDPYKTLDNILKDDNLPPKVYQQVLSLMQQNKTLRSTSGSGGIELDTTGIYN